MVRDAAENEFEKEWKQMKETYVNHVCAIRYIEMVWLPWKERFASAWTDKHRHYGTTVTSRVESAHAALKRYLEV